jgi:hypothetical protein
MVLTDQYFVCISQLHQYVTCYPHLIPFGSIIPVTLSLQDNNNMNVIEIEYDSMIVHVEGEWT